MGFFFFFLRFLVSVRLRAKNMPTKIVEESVFDSPTFGKLLWVCLDRTYFAKIEN